MFLNSLSGGVAGQRAYRQFCDVLKADLENKGITVLDYCSRPNTAVMTVGSILPVPQLAKNEADAILVPDVEIGFFADTVLSRYKLTASGYFTLIDLKTKHAVAFGGSVMSVPLDPPAPSYWTADELVSKLPEAESSLHRAATGLGQRIGASIAP